MTDLILQKADNELAARVAGLRDGHVARGMGEEDALALAVTAVCRARGLSPRQLLRAMRGKARRPSPRKPAVRRGRGLGDG